MAVTQSRARLRAEDWENAALEVIAEAGVGGVAVESLARRLGVTKGSFYWHFANRNALVSAALSRWESTEMDAFVEGPLADDQMDRTARARLREILLGALSDYRSHFIFSALFADAHDELVQPVIERVSQRRMDYLARAFEEIGLAPADASHRARLAYTAYVGFLLQSRHFRSARLKEEELSGYLEHVIGTLVPV